jgi:hypothetical protein
MNIGNPLVVQLQSARQMDPYVVVGVRRDEVPMKITVPMNQRLDSPVRVTPRCHRVDWFVNEGSSSALGLGSRALSWVWWPIPSIDIGVVTSASRSFFSSCRRCSVWAFVWATHITLRPTQVHGHFFHARVLVWAFVGQSFSIIAKKTFEFVNLRTRLPHARVAKTESRHMGPAQAKK